MDSHCWLKIRLCALLATVARTLPNGAGHGLREFVASARAALTCRWG